KDFPTNASIWWPRLDPAGRLAAFVMTEQSGEWKSGPAAPCTILLRELPSGKEVARLAGKYPPCSIGFSPGGDQLISLHIPDYSYQYEHGWLPLTQDQLADSTLMVWSCNLGGRWTETEKLRIPGAYNCLSSTKGQYLAVADLTAHSVQLLDAKTRA